MFSDYPAPIYIYIKWCILLSQMMKNLNGTMLKVIEYFSGGSCISLKKRGLHAVTEVVDLSDVEWVL